jgi:hypothetical protein
VLVGHVGRLLQYSRALGSRMSDAAVHIRHGERDVDDAVAVARVVCHQITVGVDGSLDDKTHCTGFEYVCVVVTLAGRGARVRDEFHSERGLEEVRGLRRVADHPHDGVPATDREGVVFRHR